MTFPPIPETTRLERLLPPTGRVRMVLDTDTYNEIDDQFALVHALLSPRGSPSRPSTPRPSTTTAPTGPGTAWNSATMRFCGS